MDPQRWHRIEELFEAVVDLDGPARSRFLDRVCAGDATLRAEIDRLINNDAQARAFMEDSPVAAWRESDAPDAGELADGQRLGAYRIARRLMSGGMGAVYLAVRDDDQYQQQVAIKVVRQRLDSDYLIRRFRNERQILARLDHPNICKLFDGGTTDGGLPYMVLEYIDGPPIDDFCETRGLSTNERLALFQQVCSAVAYAHRHLIVHGDIKPSNILVTGDGVPKLLDFGVARPLAPDPPRDAKSTAALFRFVTPEYASPEQVCGEAITTASDVYALGVVLYELLAGRRPYVFESELPLEIARIICHGQPRKPSSVVKREDRRRSGERLTREPTNVPTRQASGDRLRRLLRGDLDNIVLMAMRKEPQRRYLSVGELSADIQRHRDGLPVIAGEDTLAYRTGKFVRRHTAAVVAAMLILATAVVGGIAITRAAQIARRQQLRAEAAAAKAERLSRQVREVSRSLLFELSDAMSALPGSTPVRDLLNRKAVEYLDALAREAADDPSLALEVAVAYQRLGDLQGRPYIANVGDTAGALESYRKSVAILERLTQGGAKSEPTRLALSAGYDGVGAILTRMGRYPDAIESHRKALALRDALAAADPADRERRRLVAASAIAAGDALTYSGDQVGSFALYRRALDIRQTLSALDPANAQARLELVKGHHRIASGYENVGAFLSRYLPGIHDREMLHQALPHRRRALELSQLLAQTDPSDHEYRRLVADTTTDLGRLMTALGDTAGALGLYRRAAAAFEALAAADPANAEARLDLVVVYRETATALAKSKDPAAAEQFFDKAIALSERLIAADRSHREGHAMLETSVTALVEMLESRGEIAKALERYRRIFTTSNASVVQIRMLAKGGQMDEARRLTRRGIEKLKEQAGRRDVTAGDLENYAWLLLFCRPADLSNPALAAESLSRAVEMTGRANLRLLAESTWAFFMAGDQARAVAVAREILERLRPITAAAVPDAGMLERAIEASIQKMRG